MIFKTKIPDFPLNTLVNSMSYFEGFSALHKVDRFVPDGGIELLLNLTENSQAVYDDTGTSELRSYRKSWVSGIRTSHINIAAGKDSTMFVVEFVPGLTFPLFPFPMHEIANSVVEADAIFGNSIADLRERILNSETLEMKFDVLEEWLSRKLEEPNRNIKIIRHAASLLSQLPSSYDIGEISYSTGVSNKHLAHIFKQHLGIPPKQFQRIHRFQNVLKEIEATTDPDWLTLAIGNGFYDQAHLINEFKHFCGFTPSEYLKRKGPFLNYIPIA